MFPLRPTQLTLAVVLSATFPAVTRAGIAEWQNQVLNIGTLPAKTNFLTISGTAPIAFDVGALSGDRSFEFLANAGLGGPSSAFMGGGLSGQALKFEQYADTLVVGVTAYGVADYTSTFAMPLFVTTDVVFTSDGTNTNLYVGGAFKYTFTNFALAAAGVTGLAAAYTPANGTYGDNLDGMLLGFASYDSVLPAQEIADHANALAVPEPSTLGLVGVAGAWLVRGRRRRVGGALQD